MILFEKAALKGNLVYMTMFKNMCVLMITGKSSEDATTHHALLGEQVDSQAER